MNAGGGSSGQRAMASRHEFHTARVAASSIGEYFLGLKIQEAQPYRAIAKDSLQMSPAAAAAVILLGVQSNHGMAALPGALAPRIPAETYAVAQRPDAAQLATCAAGCGNAGGSGVRVVENTNRNPRSIR